MRPQSCKAKGRRLQQEVRDAVLATFPSLEPDDVRSTSMGASGADLLLSPAARKLFPYYVECKNTEKINIHQAIVQARHGLYEKRMDPAWSSSIAPLVVFRKNGSLTYAVLTFEDLLWLQKSANGTP